MHLALQSATTAAPLSSHASISSAAAYAEAGGSQRHAALVLQWAREVFAVVEPSADAARLVSELGGDPARTSLSGMCAQQRHFLTASCSHVLKLGRQEVTTSDGSQVASFLFQRTLPHRLLLPEHVQAMAGDWTGLLVISTSPLAAVLVEALLRSGAKAVVAPTDETWAACTASWPGGAMNDERPTEDKLAEASPALAERPATEQLFQAAVLGFMLVFYESLFAGETVQGAILAGEASEPQTQGLFLVAK